MYNTPPLEVKIQQESIRTHITPDRSILYAVVVRTQQHLQQATTNKSEILVPKIKCTSDPTSHTSAYWPYEIPSCSLDRYLTFTPRPLLRPLRPVYLGIQLSNLLHSCLLLGIPSRPCPLPYTNAKTPFACTLPQTG